MEAGLSQSTVNCMIQDRKGFLWFGTANGLNRYDGYSFNVYLNDPADSTSISDNGILSLYEDKNGFIWIGTVSGVLNKFDRRKGTFTRYDIISSLKTAEIPDEKYYDYPLPYSRSNDNSITVIESDNSGNFWVGTWGKGLVKFDPVRNKIEHLHYNNAPDGFRSNRIKAILPDAGGIIWVGSFGGGLYKLIPDEQIFTIVNYSDKDGGQSLSDNKVISLFNDRAGDLWVGTYGGGLNRLRNRFQSLGSSSAKFDRFMNIPGRNSLSNNIVTSIIQDNDGFLWFGTFGGGVDRYDPLRNSFTILKNDPNNPSTISKNDILSLLIDRSGTLWIGSHLGKGINNLDRNTIKFHQMNRGVNNDTGLNDDVVWAITEDDNGVTWIGTYKGGLNKYERKKGTFSYYKFDPRNPNTISDNHIRSIIDDGKGNLCIGTYSGGLNKFNKASGRATRYSFASKDSVRKGSDQIQTLFIDRAGNLWVGTFGGGLNRVKADDLANNIIWFEKFAHDVKDPFSLSDDRIYCITEDGDGIIWVGTFGGGLNKFDPSTRRFITYKNIPGDGSSLSDDRVMTIYQDLFNNLWVGTYGGGLHRFNKKTEKFTRFDKKNRPTSSVVYGILEDNNKNLWMSSDNGLFKFNIGTEIFTQYDLHDGLQSLEFSGGAYFKSSKGEMFFGGINGYNYFYPDSVKDNLFVPPVVISKIKIFNEPVIGERDSLELSYSQNFFSFEFAALDYTNPADNQYAYMMEGLDAVWHYVDSRGRVVNYTNLPPGEYVFRVSGSNNDGVWNNDNAKVFIRIIPPFYKSWWFITSILILASFLIFYLSTVRFRSLLAIEKLKGKLAADLHDNVGSGLTEISILSELASHEAKSDSSDSSRNLNLISEKARNLIDNMSDIVWMVNPQRDSFYHLILRLKDSYSDLLHSSGISFKTSNLEKLSSLTLPMEFKQNLYLIFKEGINNAIKHSGCKKIFLEASLNNDTITIILKDDGTGFENQNSEYGNGLMNMKNRARAIGSELIINSSAEGTSIKFSGRIGGFNKTFFTFFKK